MKLIWRLIKFCFLVAIILLIGQMRAGNQTIGQKFSAEIARHWDRGKEEIAKSPLFMKWGISGWLEKIPSMKSKPREEVMEIADEPAADDDESISASDREALLKLLQ